MGGTAGTRGDNSLAEEARVNRQKKMVATLVGDPLHDGIRVAELTKLLCRQAANVSSYSQDSPPY